jgi:hypothetical protein
MPCCPRHMCTTLTVPTLLLELLRENSSALGEYLHTIRRYTVLTRPSSVMTVTDQGDSDLLTVAEAGTQ